METKLIRLHFWSEDKSCHVITNNVPRARLSLMKEYDYCDVATNQTQEILADDIEMYF